MKATKRINIKPQVDKYVLVHKSNCRGVFTPSTRRQPDSVNSAAFSR